MSKLINQSRLQQFATKLWEKIKNRYDEAFVNATLTPDSSEDKKLTFTRKSGQNQLEIDLASYARLTDKNDFKQDVSADNVAIVDNRNIGTDFGFGSRGRSLGCRQLTTNSFVDGYVDHIRVYLGSNVDTNAESTWKVWAITKGQNDKNGDIVGEVIHNPVTLRVSSVTEGSANKKFVTIPIGKSFENTTYFIVQCTTHDVEIVNSINPGYSEDVVNMNNSQPPTTPNAPINWGAGVNSTNNTAIMHLYGRESIGSLSLKLKKTQADSSLYVKHSECTTEGGQANAGKVVKLDTQGKLNKNMLPSIALNEYFPIEQFTHEKLQALNHFENGDVVVVTGNGADKGKRFLCVDKENNNSDFRNAFVELNSKDGVVQSVDGKVGAVVLNLEATENSLKLKIGNGSGTDVEKSVDVITEAEITSMIENLQ